MSHLPPKNEDYKTLEYWNSRYKEEESYDWFNKTYPDLKHLIDQFINKDDKILHIGCGNSKLGPEMHEAGYKNILNTDFSVVCIENMKAKYPDQQWDVMDIRDMKVPDESFDVVLDKGTMDALLVGEKVFDEECDPDAEKMIAEAYRVIKKGGKYIQISFGQPHMRRKYFLKEKFDWDLQINTVGDFFHYYFYVLTKRA